MIRPLLTLLAAEVTAALSGQRSPSRQWAAQWLNENGVDVLVAVQSLLLGRFSVEVVDEPRPGVVSARPREQCETGRLASLGGVVFRRPCCGVCQAPVEVTLSGDAGHTGEVLFVCKRCNAREVVTFAGLMPDDEVAELLAVYRPFVGEEPS